MNAELRRATVATLLPLTAVTVLGGCVYRERTPITVPAASPPTTVVIPSASAPQRVTYPEGVYELRGDGTVNNPYHWIWIPRGMTVPAVPPPPPLPPAR